MKYKLISNATPSSLESDCIIVAVFESQKLSNAAKEINDKSNNTIDNLLKLGDFTAKLGQVEVLYSVPNVSAKRVMLVGCGKQEKFSGVLNKAIQNASSALESANIVSAVSFLNDELSDTSTIQQAITTHAAEFYRCDQYKSKRKSCSKLESFSLGFTQGVSSEVGAAVLQGEAISQGMMLTKDLANAPGNVCTPSYLAESAESLCAEYDRLDLEVLDESEMEALGMGALLSVGRGSKEASKLIVMQYKGAADDVAPIALVGKGITFDTGGISLKPGAAMDEMKYDMGGAASVFGAVRACAEMGLAINLIAVIASAENMPGSQATKPGDIVTSMSGQTIEVLNTDAEGRLVLCDALTYVDKYKPDAIVDIATLTGACIIALGHHISGLMANDNDFADEILQAGKDAGDEAWCLPMTDDYQDQLQSNFADIPNIGNDRSAGTITAACFLSRFVEGKTWAHLDIAGTAWKSGAAKGATGRPVPLLTQILINRAGNAA